MSEQVTGVCSATVPIDTHPSKYCMDGKLFSQGFTVKSAMLASFSPAFMQLVVCIDLCEESFICMSK